MGILNITQTVSLKTLAALRVSRTTNQLVSRFHSTDATNSADNAKGLRKPKTPSGKLDAESEANNNEYVHPYAEKEPLPPWPNGRNPNTGETFGPKGPEPTRYGDWERKGRVTDF